MSTQVASSTVDDRLPAMWGRLTLTTDVSSTSMVALVITARATIMRPVRAGSGEGDMAAELTRDAALA